MPILPPIKTRFSAKKKQAKNVRSKQNFKASVQIQNFKLTSVVRSTFHHVRPAKDDLWYPVHRIWRFRSHDLNVRSHKSDPNHRRIWCYRIRVWTASTTKCRRSLRCYSNIKYVRGIIWNTTDNNIYSIWPTSTNDWICWVG